MGLFFDIDNFGELYDIVFTCGDIQNSAGSTLYFYARIGSE